jgi:carbon storage regulator
MLILTRTPGSSLKIGADIEVKFLSLRGNQMRIGIAAPRETLILRSELERRAPVVDAKVGP